MTGCSNALGMRWSLCIPMLFEMTHRPCSRFWIYWQVCRVILSSKVQLAIILPLEAGPETAAAMTLTTMLRTVGQDPCSANMLCLPSAGVFRLEALFGSWPRRPYFGRFLGTGAFQMWPPFLFRPRFSPSTRFRVHGNAWLMLGFRDGNWSCWWRGPAALLWSFPSGGRINRLFGRDSEHPFRRPC